MMHDDVERVVDYTWAIISHMMIPIDLLTCIYYLTNIFGVSFIAGIVVFFVGSFINTKLNEKISAI